MEENYPVGVARLKGEEVGEGQTAALMRRISREQVENFREQIKALQEREIEAEEEKNEAAAFILSAPRSGSTLLRSVLGGSPGVFAPPELQLMNYNTMAEQAEAFSKERDAFWLDGVVILLMNLKGSSEEEARETLTGWAAEGLSVKGFYKKVQGWLGERLFVDKTPNYALDAGVLERVEEDFEGAKYVHLVRHPYGMIPSFEKAKLHVFYPPFLKGETGLSVREMAEVIWTISQENIMGFLEGIPEERKKRVSYEELVTKPEETLKALSGFLGVEYHEDMLEPQKDPVGRMTGSLHELSRMVGDVRFFEHEGISGEGAERWKESYKGDYLSEMTWQVAGELGYVRDDLPEVEINKGSL